MKDLPVFSLFLSNLLDDGFLMDVHSLFKKKEDKDKAHSRNGLSFFPSRSDDDKDTNNNGGRR